MRKYIVRAIALPAACFFGTACGNEGTVDPELMAGLVAVSAGIQHTCGLTAQGRVFCWGWNEHGQLGNGSTSDVSVPVAVSGGMTFESLAAGGGHTCGITTDGAAYCWGLNQTGQLGDGTRNARNTPTLVSGGTVWASLSAGGTLTCGIAVDGTAYCWGWNEEGQLGVGSNDDSDTPLAVAGGSDYSAIEAGNFHACGIVAGTDALHCWGRNPAGQLGDGTKTPSNVPVQVSGGLSFQTMGVGDQHTCALDDQGDLYCWGMSEFFQTATGSINKNAPTLVIGAPDFDVVGAGGNFSCALTAQGEGFCWGANTLGQHASASPLRCTVFDVTGQLVDEFGCASDPEAMDTQLRFTSLSLGVHHTCGVSTENVVYCWGGGQTGELGNGQSGSTVLTTIPQLVAGQTASS